MKKADDASFTRNLVRDTSDFCDSLMCSSSQKFFMGILHCPSIREFGVVTLLERSESHSRKNIYFFGSFEIIYCINNMNQY